MDYDKYVDENDEMVSVHLERASQVLELQPAEVNSGLYHGYIKSKTPNKRWLGPAETPAQVIEDSILGNERMDQMLKSRVDQLNKALGSDTVSGKSDLVQKSKRKKRKGRLGDELDIHAVYSGNLDKAWTQTYRVTLDKKHTLVTILLDIGGNSMEDIFASLWQAAVAYKLVEDFTAAGKSTKIIVGNAGTNPFLDRTNKKLTNTIVAKNYNERLTSSRLAAMCHLGYFRTMVFGAMCLQKHKLCSSLGSYIPLEHNLPINVLEDVKAGHTLPIVIGKSRDLGSAKTSLEVIYKSLSD